MEGTQVLKAERTASLDGGASLRLGISLSQLVACCAVFLPALTTLVFPPSSVDLTYNLRAGEVMLDTGALLTRDPFSFTAAGAPWLNQQWGAEILLALVYRGAGWAGLGAVRVVLTAALFLFVYLACRGAGADQRRAGWLTLAAFVVSLGGFITLRAQLLAMVLFALTLWILAARGKHPGRLWLIPIITIAWANLHGSFFLGPLLAGFAWLEDRTGPSPTTHRTLGVTLVSLLGTLVNPFGLSVWPYATGIATNSRIGEVISEWQPPTIRSIEGVLFFASIAGVFAFLARRGRPAPWQTLLSLGVFLGLGLLAIRGTIWWGLALAPTIGGLLGPASPRVGADRAPSRLNVALAGAVLVALIAGFVPWLGVRDPLSPPPRVLTEVPYGTTAALRRVMEPGDRMFNPQVWGSWFTFAFPENPVFVDSRIEIFPDEVWSDHDVVSTGREGWQRVLDRWNIDVVVLHRIEQEHVIPRISQDPGWRPVHEGAEGLVFVRDR